MEQKDLPHTAPPSKTTAPAVPKLNTLANSINESVIGNHAQASKWQHELTEEEKKILQNSPNAPFEYNVEFSAKPQYEPGEEEKKFYEELQKAQSTTPIDLEKDSGVIQTPSGLRLPFERSTDTQLYIERARLMIQSINNRPPLPTQVIFPNQKPEAMKLLEQYVQGIRSQLKILSMYGLSVDSTSYAFRLPHLLNEMDWINIVVRLQFATSLYAMYETLNENLSKDAKSKWGVLEYDEETKVFSVNGETLEFGQRVDVFTIDEKILSNVIFCSQEEINCKAINNETLPIIAIPLDEIKNLDSESLHKRSEAQIKKNQHLMGIDAWSFLHVLLYRISNDDEEVIEIQTDILSKEDRDPSINQKDYIKIGNMLQEQDLPYGFNHGLITALRDYYCKKANVFYGFANNIETIYANPEKFRKTLLEQNLGQDFVVENIHAITFLLDGKSKLLRLKLVMLDGTTKDAVTITRPLNMTNLGSFARFNPRELYFQEIKYIRKENTKRGFLDRMRGTNKLTPIDGDKFELVEGNPILSENVLGFIVGSAKAYYFDEESNLEYDDKFRYFHQLRKSFTTFDKLEIK